MLSSASSLTRDLTVPDTGLKNGFPRECLDPKKIIAKPQQIVDRKFAESARR
jgi:hypothetical protein